MIEVDKNTFEEVLKADGYVFVDFTVTDVYRASIDAEGT